MRFLTIALLILFASPSHAAEGEFELKLYLQPDDTGQNTLNKSVRLRDGKLKIEESRNDGPNRLVRREATDTEIKLLTSFISQRLKSFDLVATEDQDMPRVEIQFEFDGNSKTIELEEYYAIGGVPAAYVDFQKAFFEDAFK